jgi:hypothetical protein
MTTKVTAKYFEYVQNIKRAIVRNECSHSLHIHNKISDAENIKSVQCRIVPGVVKCVAIKGMCAALLSPALLLYTQHKLV